MSSTEVTFFASLAVTLSGFDSRLVGRKHKRNLSRDVWEVGSRGKPFYLNFFF